MGDSMARTVTSWPLLHANSKLTAVVETGAKPVTTAHAGACCSTMCEEYIAAKDRVGDDIILNRPRPSLGIGVIDRC